MPSTQGRQVMDTEGTRKQFLNTCTSTILKTFLHCWNVGFGPELPLPPKKCIFGPILKGVGGDEKESKHTSYGLNIKL